MSDPVMSEATRHAILTMVELDDWEGVEQVLDPIVTDYWLKHEARDKVADGVLRDIKAPAFVVGSCMLGWLIVAIVAVIRG